MNFLPILAIFITVYLLGGLLETAFVSQVAVMVFVPVFASWLWVRASLKSIQYSRKIVYPNGFPGDQTDITIRIKNNKWLPLSWIRMTDIWPKEIKPIHGSTDDGYRYTEEGKLTNIFNLRWHETVERRFTVQFTQRGVYHLGPVQAESGDFLGLFSRNEDMLIKDAVTVYPALLPLETIHWDTDDPFGETTARQKLFVDPNIISGIRPYQPGDRFRNIHWPATVKKGELQVKVFQPVTAKSIMIALNSSTTEHPWMGFSSELLEYAIQVSASIAYQAIQAGYAVGLISNGYLTRSDHPFFLSPGSSPEQLVQILTYLAMVSSYTNVKFEQYLMQTTSKIPYGTSLVVVSGMTSDLLSETLVHLASYRRNLSFYNLTEEPITIPGIRQIHVPYPARIHEASHGA
jgi:uncharacterized protein (DUF58 family)